MSPPSATVRFRFRMYVAGHTLNSARAIANLNALCQEHLPLRHEIEIIDVLENPERALLDNIMMTPTLVRLEPLPPVRIIGSLSASAVVLQALQITPRTEIA